MTAAKKPTQKELAALQEKHDFWVGQTRYKKVDEGQTRYFPDWVGTPFWAPEGLIREICKGVDMQGEPIWLIAPDAPAPAGEFAAESKSYTRATEDHSVPSPPYDYRPPAYASDTQSGGPANFHGNAGGPDNPRNPETEGEVPGEREDALAAFQAVLKQNAANAT